ncbi:MAG: hypothetical protein ABI880_06515 [Acidobacteriota bacterium]
MLPGKKLAIPDLLQMARRRIWLVVIPPALTFFGALMYSSTIPNLYESDMLVAIDPQSVPDTFVRPTVTLQTERRVDALQLQVLSRTTLQQLIEEFNLYEDDRRSLPAEDVIDKMRKAIKVEVETPRPRWGQEPQPTGFHVRFTYSEPALAARVTQRIGTQFVDQNVKDRGQQAGATNRFLETQLSEARTKLEAQERVLESFRQRHGQELPTQTQSNVQSQSAAQLQAQSLVESIARDRDRKQMLERLYREAPNAPPTTPPPVVAMQTGPGPVVISSLQQQLLSARANLASLELRYKPDHPDVARARRLIRELEPKVAADEAAAAAAATRTATNSTVAPPTPSTATLSTTDLQRRERLREMAAEIESLDRQATFKESEEQRVRGEIAEYQRRLEAVPGLESEWVKITRDYDTLQIAYRELLTKSSAAKVAANLETEDIGERFRIVDPANVPVHPLTSNRVRYNAGGLAVGLLLGLGIAALLELRDRSFRADTEVLEVLALPVLASVPRIESALDKARRRRRQLVASLAGATCVVAAGYVTWTLKLWRSLL